MIPPKAFEAYCEPCGPGWKAVVTIGGRTITACAATQELALAKAMEENSRIAERRRKRRPITVDPNLLTDDPHYDTDTMWNELEDRP